MMIRFVVHDRHGRTIGRRLPLVHNAHGDPARAPGALSGGPRAPSTFAAGGAVGVMRPWQAKNDALAVGCHRAEHRCPVAEEAHDLSSVPRLRTARHGGRFAKLRSHRPRGNNADRGTAARDGGRSPRRGASG